MCWVTDGYTIHQVTEEMLLPTGTELILLQNPASKVARIQAHTTTSGGTEVAKGKMLSVTNSSSGLRIFMLLKRQTYGRFYRHIFCHDSIFIGGSNEHVNVH